jgi:hypothetical protein
VKKVMNREKERERGREYARELNDLF